MYGLDDQPALKTPESSLQNFVFYAETNEEETDLQNPEVLDTGEVHFGDSGDVVSVQIPTERNNSVNIIQHVFAKKKKKKEKGSKAE